MGIKFKLFGRLDGIVEDKVLESKNRRSRFLGVPEYERIQLHAYMFLTDTTSSVLIENLNGVQREHEVMFDHEFWNEIMESLFVAVHEIDSIVRQKRNSDKNKIIFR